MNNAVLSFNFSVARELFFLCAFSFLNFLSRKKLQKRAARGKSSQSVLCSGVAFMATSFSRTLFVIYPFPLDFWR